MGIKEVCFHFRLILFAALGDGACSLFVLLRRAMCKAICSLVNRRSVTVFSRLKNWELRFSWFCHFFFVFRLLQLRVFLWWWEKYWQAQQTVVRQGQFISSRSVFFAYLNIWSCVIVLRRFAQTYMHYFSSSNEGLGEASRTFDDGNEKSASYVSCFSFHIFLQFTTSGLVDMANKP